MIENEDDVRRYGRTEVLGTTSRGDPPEIGEDLQLDPCVEIPWPDTRASADRPCPRVDLLPENNDAMLLLRLQMSGYTSSLAPAFAATLPPRERRAAILRVHQACHGEGVAAAVDAAVRRRRSAKQ